MQLDKNRPYFSFRLNLNEFSILNVSEMDGLMKYGGSGDFQLKMAKEGSNVVWNVTVDNPRLMELLGIFVGEKTMKLVQTLDPNNLDPNQKIALEAIKSLSRKLEEAQKNPVWDSVKLSGTVSPDGTNWVLQGREDKFNLAGDKLQELKSRSGRPVVADGFVKTPGQFEVTRFIDQKPNTLELFVMSQCPFGQRAETMLYDFLNRTNAGSTGAPPVPSGASPDGMGRTRENKNGTLTQLGRLTLPVGEAPTGAREAHALPEPRFPKPKLEIHYIFYKQNKDGKDVFVSMHGDAEVAEDLVQMTIRDHFTPTVFETYLRLRNKNGSTDWQKLAEQSGLTKDYIASIETSITTNRDALIRSEYDYVAGQCEVADGSPSYLWESEKVADLKRVTAFKGIESTQENCSH